MDDRLLSMDWKLPMIEHTWRRSQYHAYLCSPAWQWLRRSTLRRDRYRCQRCGRRRGLAVHHLTYARVGHESLGDLTTLCQSCHAQAHGRHWWTWGDWLRVVILIAGLAA